MDAKQNISSIRHFLTMRHTDCDAFAEMGLNGAGVNKVDFGKETW